jgi:hypothetical protein
MMNLENNGNDCILIVILSQQLPGRIVEITESIRIGSGRHMH